MYLDALNRADQNFSIIRDSNYQYIIDAAISCWNDYEPVAKDCESVGVDSSWNKRSFQGLDLYAVDAVSVNSKNEILAAEWDTGLKIIRNEMLESKALLMESRVTESATKKRDIDIISIDGSLASRFSQNNEADIKQITDIIKTNNNVIFVSKNSDTKTQFSSLGAKAADIYYFNHIGDSAGFSAPFQSIQSNPLHGNIMEIYARIRECTPIIKIEISDMAVGQINDSEIKKLLDMLSFHTVAGYPYCLKLAHQNCKISRRDIDRIVSLYGLKNEVRSRDLLNE
ncbi:MAG TPA: DNA double-strand break repair nuclease NurA [Nitrososphaeraceae archaeon]|nr:DNA double-strand break repair nuclease NurA [Nitrososphaeraceae archaeon]